MKTVNFDEVCVICHERESPTNPLKDGLCMPCNKQVEENYVVEDGDDDE